MSLASHGRRGLLIGLPCVSLLLLVSALVIWRGQRLSPRPVYAGESELAGAIGVNLDAGELADPGLPAALTALSPAGARWVRFVIPWDQVEPAPGQYDWRLPDRVFAQLRAQPTLKPLVVLNGSPHWARRDGDAGNPLAPPQERAHFGAFAAAVARRYGHQVRDYQVWHEPNIAPHWGARPVAPEDYAGLLREAALQIRAADPDARIVLAALAPNTEPGGANMSDVAFLDALYRLGARPWFDAVAAQPYGFADPPDAPASPAALNFARAALLRDVMMRHGDGAKRIWATAFGWAALPAAWAGQPSPWGQVDEASQARYAGQAVELAATRWPWLGPLFWAANCSARPAGDPWRGFALCAADGSPRPAWGALEEAAQAPAALPLGDHAVSHPALRYSAGWRLAAGAADPSADGDSLAYDFTGTETALRVQGGLYWAYYRVSVDGQPANALPRDETGAAYLVLYDPTAEVRLIALARNLPPGRHQVRLEARGGWGQWALRGIQVRDASAQSPSAWPDWRVLALAAIALAAALLWLMRARLGRGAAWLMARLDAMRAAAWPDAAWYGLAAALALVCAYSRWLPLDFAALAGLGLLFLARPDVALPLIAFAIPLWPRPKTLIGLEFSLYELLIWLALAAAIGRWLLSRLAELPGHHSVFHVAGDASATPPYGMADENAPSGFEPLGGLAGTQPAKGSNPTSQRAILRVDAHAAGGATAIGNVAQFAKLHYKPVLRAGCSGNHWMALANDRLRLHGLDCPVLALLAVGLLASLAAERAGVALREFRTIFLLGALFYGLVTRVPWSAGRSFSARPLVYGLLAGMTFVSLMALWQFVTGQGRIDVEGVGRVRAFYGSPNNLALVLDRAVPLGLALAAFGASRPGRVWERALFGLASGIMLLACVVTYSKGALLLGLPVGMAVVLLGGAWRSRRRWPLWALAGLALVGGAGLLLLTRTPRFADLTNLDAGTGFFRVKLWQSAWRMLLDQPWLGVGPDNFLYAYRTRYVLPSAWQELNLSHPHNIVLDLGTRLGGAGLVVGAWAVLGGLRRGWRMLRGGDDRTWPLALGLLAGLAATLAHGLIDNSLFLIDLMALFMLGLGVIQRIGVRDRLVAAAALPPRLLTPDP